MQKGTLVLGAGAVLVAAAGAVVAVRHASASTRAIAVVWRNDPTRHVDANYAEITASTDTGMDVEIQIRLVHAATGAVVSKGSVSVDPDTPFDSSDDSFVDKVPLTAYASGTQFIATADFLDASGNVNGSASLPFTKP